MQYFRRIFLSFCLSILPMLIFGQSIAVDTFMLFFLGGQSNMEGYGFNDRLPDTLMHDYKDVMIFQGNAVADGETAGGLGLWTTLGPGHGVGFSSDGHENRLSDRFGLELTLAARLGAEYPKESIAFIKYARGGSSLDSLSARYFGSWEPSYKGKGGVNQYDHFLETVKNAFSSSDINKDGRLDVLIPKGIFWMQGEGDAETLESSAYDYEKNLRQLMDLMRQQFGNPELPVIIGKISDSGSEDSWFVWPYGSIVMDAQESFVKHDPYATIVRSTSNYSYSDIWHYNTEGYLDLGRAFAAAYIELVSRVNKD